MNNDGNKSITIDELDAIWKECPAYMIDWIRNNADEIKWYLIRLNKNINEFLKEIK